MGVFFTVFATIDSLTLLGAITGTLVSSIFSLKGIADLEHDLTNSMDFLSNLSFWEKVEYAFLAVNVVANIPFLGSWWMTPPQLLWAVWKLIRLATAAKMSEKD